MLRLFSDDFGMANDFRNLLGVVLTVHVCSHIAVLWWVKQLQVLFNWNLKLDEIWAGW